MSDREGSTEEFEVEQILGIRENHGRQEYLVKWKDFPPSENTWEPEEHMMKSCESLLDDFLVRAGLLCPERKPAASASLRAPSLSIDDFRRLIRAAPGPALEVLVPSGTSGKDSSGVPLGFQYTDDLVPGKGVAIPDLDFIAGCACFDCFESAGDDPCPCINNGRSIWTGIPPVLKDPEDRSPIYECNRRCFCGPGCRSRVFQQGRRFPLAIKRFLDARGWGVVAAAPIPRGSFVAHYSGTLRTAKDADKLHTKASSAPTARGRYLFDLDLGVDRKQGGQPTFTIDAWERGNVSRFINHSCSPNLAVRAVFVDVTDARLHRVAFFAIRDISAGEELAFDYSGGAADRRRSCDACRCGSHNCRGFI